MSLGSLGFLVHDIALRTLVLVSLAVKSDRLFVRDDSFFMLCGR